MKYQVIKTITHEQGWSAAFRQWRAESHCRFLHGYALSVEMIFEADDLDSRNWVIDFGMFKDLRTRLASYFDHRTVVAKDDPMLDEFRRMSSLGICEITVLDNVGCEAFAEFIFNLTNDWLAFEAQDQPQLNRVRLMSVEVREHGSNGAKVCR